MTTEETGGRPGESLRVEDDRLLRGEGRFADDLKFTGQAGKFFGALMDLPAAAFD